MFSKRVQTRRPFRLSRTRPTTFPPMRNFVSPFCRRCSQMRQVRAAPCSVMCHYSQLTIIPKAIMFTIIIIMRRSRRDYAIGGDRIHAHEGKRRQGKKSLRKTFLDLGRAGRFAINVFNGPLIFCAINIFLVELFGYVKWEIT